MLLGIKYKRFKSGQKVKPNNMLAPDLYTPSTHNITDQLRANDDMCGGVGVGTD